MDKKLKLKTLLTVVVATIFTVFIPQNSLAWFDDQEISSTSTLSASTLEFSASPVNDLPAGGIAPYEDNIHTLNLTKIGTLDFNYSITLVNFDDGVNDGSGLCNNLTIKDDTPGSTTTYPIKDYILNIASYPTSSSINFTIRLISDASDLQDQTCNFDYKITAWQTDMPDDSTGFSDQKLVSDSILSDPWAIPGSSSEYIQQEENNTGDEEQQPGQEEDSSDEEDQIEPEEDGKTENTEDGLLLEEDDNLDGVSGDEKNEGDDNNDANDNTDEGEGTEGSGTE
jgi:hypothetical protein